jgi:1-aminocyclopropane-1-carboxylate deaminase/D-cysteine desulfhydrase-like pyridoxal-dependent ACC family enzyme
LHDGIYFKRDDLYKPFKDFRITGGKVRQCLYLIESNLKHIRDECDSTIATAASVFSPQATIVSRVAKEFGLKCIIGVGTATPMKHRAMQICVENGAEIITLVTANAYNNVLYTKLAELNKTRKFFTVNFGYQASSSRDAIIEMNALQVQNIPKKVKSIVIPVGSGVSSAGILVGVQRYRPDILKSKSVYMYQPFGYDRKDVIYGCANLDFGTAGQYEVSDFAYHKAMHIEPSPGFVLDAIYEAKSYLMMIKNLEKLPKPTCFWLVGDSNMLREKS